MNRTLRICGVVGTMVLVSLAGSGCGEAPRDAGNLTEPGLCVSAVGPVLESPEKPQCDNDRLAGFEGLLVIAPHPDDEMLAFAGLIDAYLAQEKPVEVIVSTDGDAYCDACQFWKNGSMSGETCDALDLSNLETEAVDSFAEVRRAESRMAAGVVGLEGVQFLGYPDTGLAAAWVNLKAGESDKLLNRSDFSGCDACGTCGSGYGAGPQSDLSATTLQGALASRLAATTVNTLVATTHWLDGHGDHAALGEFVRMLNEDLTQPRTVAFGVVHANTPKEAGHPDCWYPGPLPVSCPCFSEECASADPEWIADLRAHRYRPGWPAALPDDADYGTESQLCLAEHMFSGQAPTKLRAVESYASQLGFVMRDGDLPEGLGGMLDCSGYLISFVRSTEAFVLVEPNA